jgi:spermidine synthase
MPGFSLVYRFVMCIAVVLPASLGMGATIPIMSRLIHEQGRGVGRSVGFAYGINTLGAVVGCLATGFFLLEHLGMQNSLFAASALNAIVVVSSFALSRGETRVEAPALSHRVLTLENLDAHKVVLLGLYFAVGFMAIGFEVTWMRMVAIFTTNGLTTFTLGLSVYLTGFSLGSLALYPLLDRRLTGLQIFIVSTLGVAITCLAVLPNAQAITNWIAAAMDAQRETLQILTRITLMEVGVTAAIMFAPTVFMGLAFPAVCKAATERDDPIALHSGFIYFVGNLGSMAGALVTGLVLIPGLSMVGVSGWFIAGSCLVAVAALSLAPFRHRRVLQLACLLLCVPGLAFGASDTPLLHRGTLEKVGDVWKFEGARSGRRSIIRHRTGASATVTIHQFDSRGGDVHRMIFVDDQPVAASQPFSAVDSKMLAHIPLLLHPDPKTALTVGFGSGGTSWSMTVHGVQTDVVEIEPEVVQSAHLFEMQNHGVLDSPLLNVVLNDARNYLYITRKKYDVISTDATNLQYKQNGSLYTREYFELMREALAEGGIACAWIPINLTDEEFGTLVGTFRAVFPNTTLWFMDQLPTTFAVLIGSPDRLEFDYARMQRAFEIEEVAEDLAEIGIYHPFQLIHFLYLDEFGVASLVDGAPLHTDDHPILEFRSHLTFYGDVYWVKTRIQEMWPRKPRGLEHLVRNLGDGDLEELGRYERFAHAWGDFTNRDHFTAAEERDPEFHRDGIRRIDEALREIPDYPLALAKRRQYEKALGVVR